MVSQPAQVPITPCMLSSLKGKVKNVTKKCKYIVVPFLKVPYAFFLAILRFLLRDAMQAQP